jgi:hypothetical protein
LFGRRKIVKPLKLEAFPEFDWLGNLLQEEIFIILTNAILPFIKSIGTQKYPYLRCTMYSTVACFHLYAMRVRIKRPQAEKRVLFFLGTN